MKVYDGAGGMYPIYETTDVENKRKLEREKKTGKLEKNFRTNLVHV